MSNSCLAARTSTALLAVLILAACGKSSKPDDPEVTRLVRQLRNGKLEERQAAAEALARYKSPRAVEQLIVSLTEPQPAVRQAAAFTLGETGDKRAVPGLIRLTGDSNVESRKVAIEALAKIGDEKAIPAIVSCLCDPILSVRYAVGPACAKLGPPSLKPLLDALRATNTAQRAAAAAALGHVRNPQSADALLAALDDPHLQVRQAAAEALGVLGDERAATLLAKLLREPLRASDDNLFWERMAAAIPEAEARAIAKVLAEREGQQHIPNAVATAMQRLYGGGKTSETNGFIQEQTAELRELVAPPSTPAKTAEIAAIISDRISPERWQALSADQQATAIARETANLQTLWEQPASDLKQEQLNRIVVQRHGRRWWQNLTAKQREDMVRQEYLRPIQDEQRYAATEMRRSVARALARINKASALEALLQGTAAGNREIRDLAQAALQALEPDAIPALTAIVNNAQLPLPLRAQALTVMSQFRDPDLVDAFMAVANGTEPALRTAAAHGLATLGDARAIAPLSNLLKEGDVGGRRTAAAALGGLQKADAVPALLAAVNDMDSEVRRVAIDALGRLGDARAADPVLAAFQREIAAAAPSRTVLAASIVTLGRLKERRAVEAMIKLLDNATKESSENDETVGDAAAALGRIGDPRAVEPLMALLRKRLWRSSLSAAAALGEIGDPRAIALLAANTDRRPYHEMPAVAIAALGKIKDPKASETLVGLLAHRDADTRTLAAEALIAQGERVVPRLMTEFGSNQAELRGLVAQTLGYIGKPAVEPLLKALQSPPIPEALPAIIYALSMIRDERIAPPLIEKLRHPSPEIRANAAWALGYCETETALFALQKALKDEDAKVRASAAGAIDRLRPLLAAPPTGGANLTGRSRP